jgi:hypothetical protein
VTVHDDTVAPVAAVSDSADAHAASRPDAIWAAAASAARSAAAWARCLAMTAEPTTAPATVRTSSTVITPAAITLAEPRPEAALHRRNGLLGDGEPR